MKKLLVLSMLFAGGLMFPLGTEASGTDTPDAPIITPYAAIKEWRYKTINGHVYKRLYNATDQK